jgi:hypothetical protein
VKASENSEARRKCLFGKGEDSTDEKSSWTKWTTEEEAALVQYDLSFLGRCMRKQVGNIQK